MGGTAASRITAAGGNFDGTMIGGSGGAQNQTLTQAQLPAVAPTFAGNQINLGTLGLNGIVSDVLMNHTGAVGTNPGGFSGANAGVPTVTIPPFTPSGSISNLGSGQPHPIMPPAIILPFILRI